MSNAGYPPMRATKVRFDAPFWAALLALLALVILVGSAGFVSLAGAAQDAAKSDAMLVAMDDS